MQGDERLVGERGDLQRAGDNDEQLCERASSPGSLNRALYIGTFEMPPELFYVLCVCCFGLCFCLFLFSLE